MEEEQLFNKKVSVIGMGYVGLPLAIEVGRKFNTVGFDVSKKRICQLINGNDLTGEVSNDDLNFSDVLFSSDHEKIRDSDIYIVAVPTPIDNVNRPDLNYLKDASELVGSVLSKDNIVIYESTVYPGATEEVCVPILERYSGLLFNKDFSCGYSPERINPGDTSRRITDIVKVTSGSNPHAAKFIDRFYSSFITAGTFKAKSIKVAEAAKVIENTQRDLNIALINEFSKIFNLLDINTHDVLSAARTKWNFIDFVPGLVGGHCIGVDPYYLTYKAQEVGHHPELISAGRRVNDAMPKFIADKLIRTLMKSKIPLQSAKILVLGATFKENCPDLRNSKVIELVTILQGYGLDVDIFDPHISSEELQAKHDLRLSSEIKGGYNAIILAVKHSEFLDFTSSFLRSKLITDGVIFDLKNIFPLGEADLRL